MNEQQPVHDVAKLRGVFRVQILENGEVKGDSGWCENKITDTGDQHYLVENLYGGANSKRVTHLAIGTGTAPDATHTVLAGELSTGTAGRPAVNASVVASKTAQFTCQFGSATYSSRGSSHAISNLGLFHSSSGGTIFAGNTYTSSQWNTSQDVNATYQVQFPN